MTTLLATLILAAPFAAPVQDPQQGGMMPPPKELRALDFLKGEWDCDLTMWEPGSTKGSPVKATVNAGDTLGGMYIESRFTADMGGMPMTGYQLTSYNSDKKQYFSYWFDSMAPGGLELWGTVKGQTLIMTSKPTAFPGMPGKMAFRATNSLKGPGKVLFRMEMNMGKGGWVKMLEGMMTKK